MVIRCIKDYEYRDDEVTFPFHAGTEYRVAEEWAAKLLELTEYFEAVETPKAARKK